MSTKTVKRRGICCSFYRSVTRCPICPIRGLLLLLSLCVPTRPVASAMDIIGSAATETLVQTEIEGPFCECSTPIDRESLYSIHWYANHPVCDAPFCRTFCFRLCTCRRPRGVTARSALSQKQKVDEITLNS